MNPAVEFGRRLRVLAFHALLLCAAGCGGTDENDPDTLPKREKPARNVILLIGDGMGPAQLTLARIAGPGVHEGLALEKTPFVGLVKTYPAGTMLVTDSAAAATAFACARKTTNGTLGESPDGTDYENLTEWCRKRKKSVGLVTTASVTHATPAAFAVHCPDRNKEADVAQEYLGAGVDILFGGGLQYFPESRQAAFREAGYGFVRSRQELLGAERAPLIGLFADRFMDFEIDRPREVQPSLEEMAMKAIQILSRDEDGFFLMIEGGRIDMACHGHDAATMVRDVVAFDLAVQYAVAFAERDGNTLVLVTADHSTGGLAIGEQVSVDRLRGRTASAERMRELTVRGNRPLPDVVREHAGFEVTDRMLAQIEALKAVGDPKYSLHNAIADVLSRAAGVTFIPLDVQATHLVTKGHDGCDVPLFAWGPRAADFTGVLDNTEVGARIRRAMEAGK